MSDHPSHSHGSGEGQLQRAFDEAAPTLDLELETPPSPAQEPRMVGAFAPAAHVTTDTDTSSEPETAANEDGAIQALIEQWETASRDSLAETAKEVTTDPYAIVKPVEDGGDTVRTVSHAQFTSHTQSQAFQELYNQFKPKDPREVTIQDVAIEYVGDCLASTQYTTSEEGEDGTHRTKVAAIVVKKDGEWKYAVYTKHATTQNA